MNLTNPHNTYVSNRNGQRHAYLTGTALKRHVEAIHKGELDEKCPACIELKRKTEEEKRRHDGKQD